MFELMPGNEVVLYWRSIKESKKALRLEGTAQAPGVYAGRASRAYEYYTDEHKAWAAGLVATITPNTDSK